MEKPSNSLVPRLRIAVIGCGMRAKAYLKEAAALPHLYTIAGAADPVAGRVAEIRAIAGNAPGFRSFATADELLSVEKFADVLLITTQDNYHYEPCVRAMELGYDILLEKPIANDLGKILRLEKRARELGRRVLVCHVLRYSRYYRKVKEIVSSGALGDVISIAAGEGVEAWHQAHSYVRGKWAKAAQSTPMIASKCSHDLDLISWIMGRPCTKVSSYGSLTYFRRENMPAGALPRCTDGCPVESTCAYNALQYASMDRRWAEMVMDGASTATPAQIVEWLKTSPWGRCVYQCDNDVVDHQVVAMEFEGGRTATLTMTAFASGRPFEVFGTKGMLRASRHKERPEEPDITVQMHATGELQRIQVYPRGVQLGGHDGSDRAIMFATADEMRAPADSMRTSLAASIQSHLMAFGAEVSRVTGKAVDLPQLAKETLRDFERSESAAGTQRASAAVN